MSNRDIWKQVNWMDREEIIKHLESASYQCYDNETTQELKQCLVDNVEDGTIVLSN